MEKAYDAKDLALKLQAKGLDVAEDAAKVVLEAVVEWINESAVKSEGKIDDLLVPLMAALKPIADKEIDKIDKKEG